MPLSAPLGPRDGPLPGSIPLVAVDRSARTRGARDLDLTETTLRNWVKQAQADRTHGRTGLTTAERDELTRLRKENRVLREEREILKKAAAFFANERR